MTRHTRLLKVKCQVTISITVATLIPNVVPAILIFRAASITGRTKIIRALMITIAIQRHHTHLEMGHMILRQLRLPPLLARSSFVLFSGLL